MTEESLATGARLGDRFVVDTVIGRGGMSTVYRALDERTGSSVAIKVLAEGSDTARFNREAELLAEISHPAVVEHIAAGVAAGRPYLVMELLPGCDLAARLDEDPLELGEVLRLARRLCQGLAAVHERGIIHRDIKPSNLFLVDGDPGAVRLVDFGIAKRTTAATRFTRTGVMLGTVGYMAPEQIRAARDLDARADLFSLGCVLYECLTGGPPFRGADAVAVLAKVLVEVVPPTCVAAPHVPQPLAKLVDGLLAKFPADRPASANEVNRRLADLEVELDSRVPLSQPLRTVEQRVICTIMLQPGFALDSERGSLLVETASRFGGHAMQVAADTVVVTFDSSGGAADRAVRAGMCGASLHKSLSNCCVAITSGYSYATEHAAAGSALDRASQLVAAPPSSGVLLDELTVSLLGDRFRVDTAGDAWLLGPEARAPTGPRAVGTLLGHAAPCVGRRKELALLSATVDEVEQDCVARVVLLTGPPGIGKSRLAGEVIGAMRGRDWLQLQARATPVTSAAAGSLVRQLVRGAFGVAHGAESARFAGIAEGLAALDVEAPDRIAEFLGELIGVVSPSAPSPQLRAARADSNIMQRWLAVSFREWLVAECAKRPVMCVLEDLHWADSASLMLLNDALEHLEEAPLFVLAMARSELVERFPRLWRGASVQQLVLGRLTRAAARKLVSHGLPRAGDDVVADVVERGSGNPFFLEELVRAVAAGHTALPDTVLAVAQERIERQDAQARRALRAASVFGERCWLGGVAWLLGADEENDTRLLLDELVRSELLRTCENSRFPDQREYAFRHALLCDAAYAMLPEDEHPVAHGRAARWLELVGETEPMVLAEHWNRAGDTDRTKRWLLAAIAAARAAGDVSLLLEHAARGLDLAEDPSERAQFRLAEVFGHAYACAYERVLDARADIMPYLEVGSTDWCTMLGLIAYSGLVLGDHAAVAYTTSMLAQNMGTLEPSGPAALALTTASASALLLRGREANRPYDDTLRAMNERVGADDLVVRGWCLHAATNPAMYTRDGSAAEVVSMIEEERRCFDTAGAAMAYAIAAGWSAYCLAAVGAVDLTDERAAAAIDLEQRGGGRAGGRFGLVGMAMVRLSADPQGALARATQLIESQGQSVAAVPGILLAHIALSRGHLAEVSELVVALAASPYLPGKVAAQGFRAALALAGNEPGRGLAEVESALELVDSLVSLPITRSFLHRLRVEILWTLNRRAAAAAAAQVGRARLHTIAEGLEPNLRPGFWQRGPFVAESLALFDEVLAGHC
jgi:hypothetical protein